MQNDKFSGQMAKIGLIKFLVLFFVVSTAWGQKVKYKDIFALLSTKQYEQAEPFLKKYLVENDDNPNAFLFRGIIFQEKSVKSDILKQTALTLANIDSAILFLDKAIKSIDEKEVRRNKEYYQAYNRRDLRTGEFGVKLSDIQFDIEKRITALRERSDKVKMTKHYFSLADTLYKTSNSLFNTIQKKYSTDRQLYLRADESTVADLKKLSLRFDSCTKAFESYTTSSSNLGNTGYNQVWSLTEIKNFEKEGASLADFYRDDLSVWDYKKFGDKTVSIIEKEIFPMREHLITYDIEINKLREKLNHDSISVRSDLTKLIDRLLYDQLRKFDQEPLPMEVFSLKTADLEYRSALLENIPFRDSADVHLKFRLVQTEIRLLNKLDSIADKLSQENIDKKALDYEHFIINTYSNPIVLKSYVKALKEYAVRERRGKDEELALRLKATHWIVDGADSIPIHQSIARNNYRPLSVVEEKYTIGLHVIDSANSNGYFYTITPSRKADLKVVFPVDKSAFKEARLPVSKALSYADDAGNLYYALVYSERPIKEKYSITLAKIYRSDGLAWSNNFQIAFIPKELILRSDTGELTIKNETQQTVIDKNGKVIR